MSSLAPFIPAEVSRKLSILCIDDSKCIRDILELALTREGHRVATVSDGGIALQLLSSDPSSFDLVITDHVMPVMSGLELVSRLRALHYHGGILVLSSSLESNLANDYRKLGVSDLLDKPIELRVLWETINRLADASSSLSKATG